MVYHPKVFPGIADQAIGPVHSSCINNNKLINRIEVEEAVNSSSQLDIFANCHSNIRHTSILF
ncbi:hypothetical protein HanPSC8_Chr05g0229451 [Helianthus annuus]|nr:hypothetical protein HanPSC8_Chr05g0229451 [Helianthus annuus]